MKLAEANFTFFTKNVVSCVYQGAQGEVATAGCEVDGILNDAPFTGREIGRQIERSSQDFIEGQNIGAQGRIRREVLQDRRGRGRSDVSRWRSGQRKVSGRLRGRRRGGGRRSRCRLRRR